MVDTDAHMGFDLLWTYKFNNCNNCIYLFDDGILMGEVLAGWQN
jgi:hypothetical protein